MALPLTVVFDLDGTLVDTAPDLVGALNVILDQDGLAQLPLKQARMMVGRGARGLLSQGFAAAGQPSMFPKLPWPSTSG